MSSQKIQRLEQSNQVKDQELKEKHEDNFKSQQQIDMLNEDLNQQKTRCKRLEKELKQFKESSKAEYLNLQRKLKWVIECSEKVMKELNAQFLNSKSLAGVANDFDVIPKQTHDFSGKNWTYFIEKTTPGLMEQTLENL